ncbi:bifunctional 3,4-dihydroxy-2-butanone-4-phosphate synthase/GTP cyclohydrolase II [Sulfobacillus harzensis]|uniref:Riboflavin biosynthesis protein RibBA n=1 Tax=Sulfobacillus harzensis TaxID=2729629 RepID=A0A7Y0Q1H5_9FIRM|nr:bifunctional 3,4-dihydroxy-2-butanone-4-phosphate synthase/GTP cyclohydrolase II [Sulfobacillus harzensis]NMP21467.1 bifunctional 3,4-dihydroxy-2-butanone-4-phosphate synthase/GTP cyclohydrolase II [Sulfobacillus harzensis]
MSDYPFQSIEEAIRAIQAGQMIIVVDDESRENEGDLIIAARHATADAINFMAQYGRGLICVPMDAAWLDRLQLPPMVEVSEDSMKTAFTVSVDARHHTTTGISAHDRAQTVQVLANPTSRPEDLVRPGHMFPLRAKPGGVLRRPGHTEAAVDLAVLAGLEPVAVICEIMKPDGTMARLADLTEFAATHHLVLISIQDLIRYRLAQETLYVRDAETTLPTRYGTFRAVAYTEKLNGATHLALTMGNIADGTPVLTRVHSECLTGDVFGSLRCDCGEQLDQALRQIAEEGRGCLLYMRQEGRGIGLANKIKAYALQETGMDTVAANLALGFPPDMRDYGVGAQILRDLGIRELRLLTNNPDKYYALEGYGLRIVERVPIEVGEHPENQHYLKTKRDKMGHWISTI